MYFVKLQFITGQLFDLVFNTEEEAARICKMLHDIDGKDTETYKIRTIRDDFGHVMTIKINALNSVFMVSFEDSHRRSKVIHDMNEILHEKYCPGQKAGFA